MYDLYDTLNGNWFFALITIIAFILSLLCLEPILNLFSKKHTAKEGAYLLINKYGFKKPLVVLMCLVCAFVLFFSNRDIVWLLDGKDDLRLAPDGTYCYYVIANRDDSSKQYTLPAKINKHEGDYFVENVYFPNGGYLYFNSYEYREFDELIHDADQDCDFWEIRLTNRKTTNLNVTERYTVNFWEMFFTVIATAVLLIESLILLFTKNDNGKER